MVTEKRPIRNYKIKYKMFEYIDVLTDFFNEHIEFELISVLCTKDRANFISVYKDFTQQNEQDGNKQENKA